MPTPTKGPRLGGGPAHERMLLANMARSLFINKSVTTTEVKAKRLRPVAERLVTFAKRGDLHSRRRVMQSITDRNVVHELFVNIAPQVAERQGGYTRITKLGFRKGDNAPMAVIELVLDPVSPKKMNKKPKLENAVKAAPKAEVVAEEVVAEEVVAETPVEEVAAVETAAAEAVVVDMAYNLGAGGLSSFVNFKEAIRSNDWNGAAKEMANSKYCKQVKSRCTRN